MSANLNDGIRIPQTPNTSTPYYSNSGAAYAPYGYETQSSSGTHVAIPALNGSQSWSGANTFSTSNTTVPAMDSEGFFTSGPSLIVTGIDTDSPAGMGVAKTVVADTAYNAVWNDLADCIEVPEGTELEYGRAYCFDGEKYCKSDKYLADGFIGIHTDTAGLFIGDKGVANQLKAAVAGFVLAYVDKVYKPGTPLTCGPDGVLTELKEEDIETNPHKLVGTFWKEETEYWWGYDDAKSDNLVVEVKGRHWIKVR